MPSPVHIRILAVVAVLTLVVAACSDSEPATGASATPTTALDSTPATTTTITTEIPEITLPPRPPSDYAGFTAQPTACGAAPPAPVTPMTFAAPEDQALVAGARLTATITTSCGDIVIELDQDIAPETVNSFVFLARAGYFNGTVSHRIVPGFVIQAGDPTATGREGPGYTIPDELPEPGFLYERGTLAMANSGPNSTGSQFFIVVADAPLNPDFSVFGHVIDGFETLDRITALPLGPNAFGEVSVPLETLYIDKVVVSE